MNHLIYSVEDDLDIQKIIKKTLEKQGYIVESFSDGKSFFDAFNKKIPNLVLLDMMLPDYSGDEILKEIRDKHSSDEVSVIIVSAKGMITDKVDGLDLGADDYISKPFDILELMARVNVQLRHHNVKVYEAQGVVVDIDSHIVKYNDSAINLTVKEFELLALLIKNKGKAVSREEILDIIWGFDSLETRSVDMHIKSIRKKLGIDIIETVYGFGYKVNVWKKDIIY